MRLDNLAASAEYDPNQTEQTARNEDLDSIYLEREEPQTPV